MFFLMIKTNSLIIQLLKCEYFHYQIIKTESFLVFGQNKTFKNVVISRETPINLYYLSCRIVSTNTESVS